jgi:hypothetical protein
LHGTIMKIDVGNIYLDSVAYRFAFMDTHRHEAKSKLILSIVAFSVYWLPSYPFFFEHAALFIPRRVDLIKIIYSTYRAATHSPVKRDFRNNQYTYGDRPGLPCSCGIKTRRVLRGKLQ